MQIVEATPLDSNRLKDFFGSSILPGRIDLRIERHTDFFDPYRLQSDNYKTYILENSQKEIHGCATLIFRQGMINEEPQTIGFARDLRISKNRQALTQWPQHFLPILEKEMEENNCQYFFSVIGQTERESYNAFIRPKAFRKSMPRYYMLRKFQVISIHGYLPFIFTPLKTIFLEQGTETICKELVEYLNSKSRKRPLAPIHTAEKFYQEIQSWPGLQMEDFIIARDRSGKIVGCCAPWSSSQIETLFVENYGGLAGSMRRLFSAGSTIGLTRPLAKPRHPLQMSYLTHLFADNPDIFLSLLHRAWHASESSQTLVYPHFSGDYQTLPHPTFIHTKTPYAIYTLLPPQSPLPDFLRPRLQEPPPFFELALV